MKNNTEPVLTVAGIVAGVAAVLGLLTSFGIPVTVEQEAAISKLIAVVAPLTLALVARRFVTPLNKTVAYTLPSGLVVAGEASPIPTGTPVDVEVNPEVGVPEDIEDTDNVDLEEPEGFEDGSARRALIEDENQPPLI